VTVDDQHNAVLMYSRTYFQQVQKPSKHTYTRRQNIGLISVNTNNSCGVYLHCCKTAIAHTQLVK